MKSIWTEEDAECGRIIHKLNRNMKRPLHQHDIADRLYIISYWRADGGNNYCIVSMADGMQMLRSQTREELALKLTEGDYHPTSGADKTEIIKHAGEVCLNIR